VGIAAVGSVFFARVADTRGRDFAGAYTHALLVALCFVGVALLIAVVDVVVDRRISRRQAAGGRPAERDRQRVAA
jgi:hypothetical protein